MSNDDLRGAPAARPIDAGLLAHHRSFVRFVERRIGDRGAAEDVVQGAFARALAAGVPEGADESAVAWFYRVLRNALVDHVRRRGAEARAIGAHEPEEVAEPELRAVVCECIGDVLSTLKPEYADIVRRVDLDEGGVGEAAQAIGITPNNAAVRLHRARHALRTQLQRTCGACAEHGCLDCSCRGAHARLDYSPRPGQL